MLCENLCIQLEVVKTLNLATLLLIDLGPLKHHCLEFMDEVFLRQPDLTDQPISNLDIEYFTDGRSFVRDGTCFARYVVVTLDSVIESCPLPLGTSAQKAELVAHTWALQLTAGVQINIYTDLNMSSQQFMSMEPYIKREDSLTWEEKIPTMGRKSSNC
jgi:hypothetical protein